MKNLAIGIFISMVMFSCKKEPKDFQPADSAKEQKYGIQFNLKDFTPEILGMKGKQMSEVPLKDRVDFLTYIAYSEEGKEVSRIRQFAGVTIAHRYDENGIIDQYSPGVFPLGTFTDSLAAGNYTIVIIASQGKFGINSHNSEDVSADPFATAYFIYDYPFSENRSSTKDTFYKKFTIKVEDKDLTQQVVLERIVAKVEINILDAKPDVGYRFQFINEYLGMRFADNTYVDRADDMELGAAAGVTRDNSKFSSFILNTDPSMPIDIVIEAYQPSNFRPVIATKMIKNVPFFKNKVTVLTGYLHSTNTTTGFTVTVCDEFDQDTINVSF